MSTVKPRTMANLPGENEDIGPATGRRKSLVDLSVKLPPQANEPNAKPLRRRYNPHENCVLSNTGFGWKVKVTGPSTIRRADLMYWPSELSGGPLVDCFRLVQFHMHSGNDGFTHTVDGQSCDGEIHFLHWNCDKYKSFEEAAAKPDGLAMLGVLMKIGAPNKEIQKVTDLMSQISKKGQQVDITREMDLANLLPANSSYWTYMGSLTNPPCNETIMWIVCKEPITISQAQLDVMRAIRHTEDEVIPTGETKGILFKNFCPPPLITHRLRACRE